MTPDPQAARARLAARLEHRLQSTLLLLREAVDREDLAGVRHFAAEVSLRARGLAACCALGDEARRALEGVLVDWMGPSATWTESGGELAVEAARDHTPPEVQELGRPLVELLAGELGGELVSWDPGRVRLRLPS